MKKTSRSILVAAACAMIAAASYAVDRVEHFARAVYGGVRDFILGAVATIAGPVAGVLVPAVHLVRAKAFVRRLIKRDRPVVTSSWRMCPST